MVHGDTICLKEDQLLTVIMEDQDCVTVVHDDTICLKENQYGVTVVHSDTIWLKEDQGCVSVIHSGTIQPVRRSVLCHNGLKTHRLSEERSEVCHSDTFWCPGGSQPHHLCGGRVTAVQNGDAWPVQV